jgi:hypothetical protein
LEKLRENLKGTKYNKTYVTFRAITSSIERFYDLGQVN